MIWVIHPDVVHFKSFELDSEEVWRKLGEDSMFHFDPSPVLYGPQWQPLEIEFVKMSGGHRGEMPDLTVQDGRLFLNPRAHVALHGRLEGLGEFLPVTYPGGTGWLFNVLAVAETVDGVDSRLSTRNEYGDLKSLAFHEDRVKDMAVFRTAFDNYLGLYCQDAFKAACEQAGLKGVVFGADLGNIFPPDPSAGKPKAH